MRVPVTEMYELLSMIYRRMDDVSRRQVRMRFNTIETVDQNVGHFEAAEYLILSNVIRGPAPDHERCACVCMFCPSEPKGICIRARGHRESGRRFMFVSGVQMELVLEVMHVTQEDPTMIRRAPRLVVELGMVRTVDED